MDNDGPIEHRKPMGMDQHIESWKASDEVFMGVNTQEVYFVHQGMNPVGGFVLLASHNSNGGENLTRRRKVGELMCLTLKTSDSELRKAGSPAFVRSLLMEEK